MRLRPVRFTVRRMMLAVAIAAALFAVVVRFPGWAGRRRAMIVAIGFRHACSYSELGRQQPPAEAARLSYYDAMRRKYFYAA